MKKVLLASGALLCGSLAFAQATPPQTDPPNPPKRTTESTSDASDRSKGSHKMTATLVSTDQSGQQITVRDLVMKGSGTSGSGTPSSSGTAGAGETVTLRVEGKAAARLASFKAGDSIEVECRQAGSTSGSAGTGSTGTSGSTGSTTGTTGSTTGSGMSGSGQAMADAHCASVTDIGKGKSSR